MTVPIVLGFGGLAVAVAALGLIDLLRPADPESLKLIIGDLAKRNIKWTDFYASADPVPNGALHDDRESPPESIEVTNLSSIWRDHTTDGKQYQFVGQLVEG